MRRITHWRKRIGVGVLGAALAAGVCSAAERPAKSVPPRTGARRELPQDRPSERAVPVPRKAEPGAPTTRPAPSASSMIEDRAAKKLLAAGNARLELSQSREALELFQQVVERYPRSVVRFEAFAAIGKYHLDKAKDAAKALPYFERAADAANENLEQRGQAMLDVGRCFYEMQKYPQAFAALRQVILAYPGTELSNQAYFYIGNAHYKLGAYNRAIEAFARVGTAVSESDKSTPQLEIGKRLFVRINDLDLVSLPESAIVSATVSSSGGDKETVKLNRVGVASAGSFLGEIDTALGKPNPGDGVLQVGGRDTVSINYTDAQTADKRLDVARTQAMACVGNAIVDFMDGAFRDPLKVVIMGKTAYVRVLDLDRDVSPAADTVQVKVVARRLVQKDPPPVAPKDEEPVRKPYAKKLKETEPIPLPAAPEEVKPEYRVVDEVALTLTERARPSLDGKPIENGGEMHTGIFGGQVPILPGTPVAGDAALQVQNGDIVEIQYADERNTSGKPLEAVGMAQAAPGSLGEVKIANPEIRDQELEIQTHLKKAEALTNIGRIYKKLGLQEQASQQFRHGIAECEALGAQTKAIGGDVLEQMYVRLMKLYIELDELDKAASICLTLQRQFPNSQFADEALLGLGETTMKKGEFAKAIPIFKRVLDLPTTQRKADALFNIGLCQEELAKPKTPEDKPSVAMQEAAFTSFQTVFQQYPSSGVAGEAVGRIAEHYMAGKNYDRAITTLQQALDEYPDAQFIDRVLYDQGRCLYRMHVADQNPARLQEALAKFRQLMSEYPQSKLAAKAKQIVSAVEKQRGGEQPEGTEKQ